MMRSDVEAAMPALFAHEGIWEGVYRHLDPDGMLVDTHLARVEVIYPVEGPPHYVQRNTFTWADGRTHFVELPGTFRDGRMWWDNAAFHGSAWQTDGGLVLLHLHRKDVPGAWFWEVICPPTIAGVRARTWHWFDADGFLIRRTLCDEHRVG